MTIGGLFLCNDFRLLLRFSVNKLNVSVVVVGHARVLSVYL